ncbi:unnamed protein product [Coffea canephora]|uniref:Uncharacterized protein n=1 Tax=Coffea canephora TaxID=49390 RepID=A0A068U6Z4_COFCA|nr:unnamed protein product [Coffea canephora]
MFEIPKTKHTHTSTNRDKYERRGELGGRGNLIICPRFFFSQKKKKER